MAGILYLVATPIGNLEDITSRAARVLRESDLIACEDTRQTQKLLNALSLSKPTVSYHEHNEAARAASLVDRLEAGANVALVSDAGTPLVSDPGHHLVTLALERGIRIVPIPGPSAVLAALAASGLPTDSFYFAGFLPAKATHRRKALEQLRTLPCTTVFYEAPHRILETLSDMDAVLGTRPVVAARELTKIHEEFLRGTAADIRAALAGRPSVRGEFTLMIGRAPEPPPTQLDPPGIRSAVEEQVQEGLSRMDAIKAVARELRLPKSEVYRIVQDK